VKWRPRIEAWAAASLITNGRVPEGRERAMHALEQARRDGDPLSVAYSLNVLTQVSDATTQIARYDEALAGLGSDDPDSTDMRIAIIGNRATPLLYLGRVGESQEALRKASMLAERNGSFRSVTFSALAMEFAYDLGNWDEVLVIMAGIDPAHLEGPQLNHLFGIVALVALHRDDRELAIAHLRAAGVSDFSTAHMYGKGGYVTPALALLAESDGDLDRGLHIQKAWLELDTYSRFFRQYEAQVLIRMALRAGDRVTAKAAAEAADVKHSPVVMPPVVLCSRTCHALVNDDVAELMAVAQENARMSFVEQSAFNYEEAAVRLAHAGDIPLARKAFTDAVQAYDQLGATWDIRRADARLLPFGIRRGSRSLHRRAKTGWAALTPTEARIAHLVAQGKSNPDIASELYISRNTVQTHVSNILAKLQVRSRIELVREVTRAQLP
jgi:DNA-binding NarL/FixJ family response regulator